MRPATIGNSLLLICLIGGVLVLVFSISTRWLWLRPIPDVHRVVLMPSVSWYNMLDHKYRDYTVVDQWPQYSTAVTPGGTILLEMRIQDERPDYNRLLEFMKGPDMPCRVEQGKLKIYRDEIEMATDDPAWILDLTDQTVIVAKGKALKYESRFDEGLTSPGAIQVSEVAINPFPQPSTGIASVIYLSPLPHEIITRRDQIFRLLIIGGALTIIGLFYFYDPDRGWQNPRVAMKQEDPFTLKDI